MLSFLILLYPPSPDMPNLVQKLDFVLAHEGHLVAKDPGPLAPKGVEKESDQVFLVCFLCQSALRFAIVMISSAPELQKDHWAFQH